jgi:hypothetical protein
MGARGLTLLQLATLDDPAARLDGWRRLCDERTERVTLAMLRDFVQRDFLTSGELKTMQLTDTGRTRMHAVQRLLDTRDHS